MTVQEAATQASDASPPTPPATTSQQPNGGVTPAGKGKGKAKGSAAAALDPAVIEAKRRARAEKKEREALEKLLKEEEEQKARRAGLGLAAVDAEGRPLYRPRQWALVEGVKEDEGEDVVGEGRRRRPRIKVLSWNMLAQGLVRRKLFPGSDAMRWKDREAGLGAELLGHGFDVASLQEVDRIETHAATLSKGGYSHLFAKGYAQKQHGLCLAWRTSSPSHQDILFEEQPAASKIIYFDDEEVEQGRTGCSRVTRNIALVAALRFRKRDGDAEEPGGIILATTHLFWHPMHAYERVRQAGLLVRALKRFRSNPPDDAAGSQPPEWRHWPVSLAGDFNDQPHSASYALLTGRLPLDAHPREEIAKSSVVHQSVDERRGREREREAATKQTQSSAAEPVEAKESTEVDEPPEDGDDEAVEEDGDEEEEEGGEDDQILKNCRAAQPSDGLLTLAELEGLFTLHSATSTPQYMRSAYASAYHKLSGQDESDNLFSTPTRGRERWDDPDWKEGDPNVHRTLAGTPAGNEPMWTLYSSLFGLTLDYILMMPAEGEDGEGRYPTVRRLLRTHRTDVIKEGLPRKGICVSDHVAVGAELEL